MSIKINVEDTRNSNLNFSKNNKQESGVYAFAYIIKFSIST